MAELSGIQRPWTSPRSRPPFFGLGRVGELARSVAGDIDEPEMRGSAVGGGIGHGDDGLLAIRRELRVADGAGVAEVFVGGKVRPAALRVDGGRRGEGEKSDKKAVKDRERLRCMDVLRTE